MATQFIWNDLELDMELHSVLSVLTSDLNCEANKGLLGVNYSQNTWLWIEDVS